MPVTITLHKISEKKPSNYQEIIWLKPVGSFGSNGFDPRQITVYYAWELLTDGEYNGTTCCYSSPDDFTKDEANLVIMLDNRTAEPDDLWCDVEEYWDCFK